MTTETNVQSNAFNFADFLNQGVDPRTGHFMASFALPSFQSADLAGPSLALTLSYNMLNPLDSGFGKGWSLNLSRFSPQNNFMLSTATGESFKVTAAAGMEEPATVPEQKLEAFRFYAGTLATGPYRMVQRGGLVEDLTLFDESDRRVALVERMTGPLGHSIKLEYTDYRNTRALSRVLDHDGKTVLLSIEYKKGESEEITTVTLAPNAAQPQLSMTFKHPAEWLTEVSIGGIEGGTWLLEYDRVRGYDCITQVRTPQGGREVLEYNDLGHSFPGPEPKPPALPRVTRHRRYPGLDQPELETRWDYSGTNYLGNGALSSWNDDGTDQLYKATDDLFRYDSTARIYAEGAPIRTVKRFYNRFHQMVQELTEQDGHQLVNDVTYHMEPGKPFADQQRHCQLPKYSQTRWRQDGVGSRVEVTEQDFDNTGNPTREKGPDGVTVTYDYYPPEGDGDDCPPHPESLARYVKTKTVTPAAGQEAGAPVLATHYRYAQLGALADSGGSGQIVMVQERQWEGDPEQGVPLSTSTFTYHDVPADPLRHGRLRQQEDDVNGHVTTSLFTYSKTGSDLADGRIVIDLQITGFDGQATASTREIACLSGRELSSTDADGIVIHRTYDTLGRVVNETVEDEEGAHGAERSFEYQFAGPGGLGNRRVTIDINGVRHILCTDGLGREVAQYRQAGTESPEEQVTGTTYNGLGQRITTYEYDDFAGDTRALATHYSYDAWGNLYSSTAPSGLVSVSHTQPIPAQGATTVESWLEHPDAPGMRHQWQYTQLNAFGKPDVEARLDGDPANPVRIGQTTSSYDGSGRCVAQVQALRDLQGRPFTRTTGYRYDAFDRLVNTTRPDGTQVRQAYATHSSEVLPTRLAVYSLSPAAEVVAGHQAFDGLGRLYKRTVGSLTERYAYRDGSSRPWRHTQPSGYVSTYTYSPSLTDTPVRIKGSDDDRRFDYDSLTGLVKGGTAKDGQVTAFTYDAFGEVSSLTWAGETGSHTTSLTRSRLGRPLRREDDATAPTEYRYDAFGRPCLLNRAGVTSTCEYDAFGQVIHTSNSGHEQSSSCSRLYDIHGREYSRTLTLPGVPSLTIIQHWSDDDMPLSRTYQVADEEQFKECLDYDELGRLSQVRYSGQEAWFPQDRHGNPIRTQSFVFDALDNILYAIIDLANDTQVMATHTYDPLDPCRLTDITYSDGYAPAEHFDYDDNGALLNDGQGHRLRYDPRGRLSEVHDAGGRLASYRYDPHDGLVETLDGQGAQTRWYYTGLAPHHSVSHAGAYEYLNDLAGQPVAEQPPGADPLWLGTDLAGSVRQEADHSQQQSIQYDAYGQANAQAAPRSHRGFNGERRELAFEAYPLGQGYRSYLPRLRRFNAPDSASPFDGGGLNPYAYAAGNPLVYRDPTGHYNSNIIGPDRLLLPEQQKRGFWDTWLPVAVSGLLLVVGAILAPPSSVGLAAFAVSTLISTVGLTYNILVATETVDNNPLIGTVLLIADIGGGGVAQAAGRSAKNWSLRVGSRRMVNPLQRTKLARPRFNFDGLGDEMQVFKTGNATARNSIRRTSSEAIAQSTSDATSLVRGETRAQVHSVARESATLSRTSSTRSMPLASTGSDDARLVQPLVNDAGPSVTNTKMLPGNRYRKTAGGKWVDDGPSVRTAATGVFKTVPPPTF